MLYFFSGRCDDFPSLEYITAMTSRERELIRKVFILAFWPMFDTCSPCPVCGQEPKQHDLPTQQSVRVQPTVPRPVRLRVRSGHTQHGRPAVRLRRRPSVWSVPERSAGRPLSVWGGPPSGASLESGEVREV